jgi:hypothetical protein
MKNLLMKAHNRIWVPFTSNVMDLHRGFNHDDNLIHLLPGDRDFECQWWRFELGMCFSRHLQAFRLTARPIAVDAGSSDGNSRLPGAPESHT